MKRCKIEVVPLDKGVTIWCNTCKENVAWNLWFTEEQVVETAKGHRKVMAAARKANRPVT